MRPMTAPFLAIALLTSGCLAQRPPERSPLPDASTAITTPPSCAVIDGPALGVHVEDVSPGTASFGILEPEDLLTTLDGVTLTSTGDLLSTLSERSPGDRVVVGLRRGGEPLELTVTLGENPQNPDRPLLGISIATEYAEVPPEAAAKLADPGRFARAVTIGDFVYVVDPTTGRLGVTDLSPSPTLAMVVDGTQYRVEREGETGRIVDGSGRQIDVSTGDVPLGLLGSDAGDLFIVAERVDEDGVAAPVLIRAGARSGAAKWAWETTEDEGVPVFTVVSPDGSKLLVGFAIQGAGGLSYRVVDARTGDPLTRPEALSQIDGGVSFGWFDDGRIAVQTPGTTPILLDPLTLDSEPIALPFDPAEGTRLWAAGDGLHLLIDTGQTFGLVTLDGSTEVRPIARRCEVTFVDQLGSGS
jgi:hypothetical protein